MSEFNFNMRGSSESIFKVPTVPTRYRRTACNNTQSTCNNEVVLPNGDSNTYNTLKKLEERVEVLKKICPLEDVNKILNDAVDRLTEVCYEKVAEQLIRPGHSQAFSVGGSSVYSVNAKTVAPASNYDHPSESTRGRINSTAASRNYYTSLNAPNQPANFASNDQYSRINDIAYDFEPIAKTHPNKAVRSRKTAVATNDRVDKNDPVGGLSIPLRIEKPNPPPPQSKRLVRKLPPEIKELEVLPSEDDDSLSDIFGRGRRAASKFSNTRTREINQSYRRTKSHDLSVTLSRVNINPVNETDSGPSRKRKAPQQDDPVSRKKSPVQKKNDPSPDTTTTNIVAEPKPSTSTHNEVTRKPRKNNSLVAKKQRELTAKVKEKKENKEISKATTTKSKSQKETKKAKENIAPAVDDTQSNTVNRDDLFDDGSLFGDVSSIVGIDTVMLSNTVAKNSTKHPSAVRNELPSHFFSPFSNIRSTSGVSAISTPLSKSVSKNVLGKRLKKPSVVAELKGTQARKPRKGSLKRTDVAPVNQNNSESSESDEGVSDFSD